MKLSLLKWNDYILGIFSAMRFIFPDFLGTSGINYGHKDYSFRCSFTFINYCHKLSVRPETIYGPISDMSLKLLIACRCPRQPLQ